MKGNYKKFIFLFLLFSLLLGIFTPFQSALAWEWHPIAWTSEKISGPLKGAVSAATDKVGEAIVSAVNFLVIGVISRLLDVVYSILTWVISPDFLGMTMTGPDNKLVYNGWSYVRDLADIFLVLGLIVIALGIILGIKEYEAKRTLPVLIAIALLINFTPVICGWIIDFSNYLMKWLLKGGFDNGFVNAIQQGLANQGGKGALDAIITGLVFIIFGIVAIVVIGLYCLLFLMRYVFLWILIIFSPIAFVSRVFGPNKYIKMFFPGFLYWDNWWQSFIQWCIIGVFGAFFIFLANKSMVGWIVEPSGPPSFLASLYIYIFPIFLLLIGFFATISAASEGIAVVPGAKQAMGVMQKAAVKGGKWAGRKAGEAVPERVRRKGEEWARYMPEWTQYGKGEAGAKGWMKRRIGQLGTAMASPYIAAKQGIGRAVSVPPKIEKQDIGKAFQENLGKPVEEQLKAYNKFTATRGERIGALQAIIHDNNLDDAKKLMKEEEKEKFKAQIKSDMGEAALIGDRAGFNKIARANPHLANEVLTKLNPEIRKRIGLSEPANKEKLLKEVGERDKKRAVRLRQQAEKEKEENPKKAKELLKEAKYLESEEKQNKDGGTLGEIEKLREGGVLEKRKAEKMMNEFLKENYSFIPQVIRGIKPEAVGDMAAESLGIGKEPERQAGESEKDFEERKKKYNDAVEEVWDAIHKEWLPENNVEAIKTFKKPFADNYMKGAKERGIMWYVVNNPTMATYMTSMFAPESGLFAPEKVTLQQINAWQDRLNRLSPEIRNTFEEQFNRLKDEQRKTLTEVLKKNPDRLSNKELEGKRLEEKIKKWMEEDKNK